uniref:Uncharacterized protein n=1 Tax=Angiostrongylus cantonensis TaxID=6313 RepID=A0A158P7N9_ANGCA
MEFNRSYLLIYFGTEKNEAVGKEESTWEIHNGFQHFYDSAAINIGSPEAFRVTSSPTTITSKEFIAKGVFSTDAGYWIPTEKANDERRTVVLRKKEEIDIFYGRNFLPLPGKPSEIRRISFSHDFQMIVTALREPLYVIVQNYIRTRPRKVLIAWAIGIVAAIVGTHYVVKKCRAQLRRPQLKRHDISTGTPSPSFSDTSKSTTSRASGSSDSLFKSPGVAKTPVQRSLKKETSLASFTPLKSERKVASKSPVNVSPAASQAVLTSKPEKKSTVRVDKGPIMKPVKPTDNKKTSRAVTPKVDKKNAVKKTKDIGLQKGKSPT